MKTDMSILMNLTIKLSLIIYTIKSMHVINNLIMIEFMAISISASAMLVMTKIGMEMHLTLFILVLLITESILGLSAMISVIRTHGNDYLKSSLTVKY